MTLTIDSVPCPGPCPVPVGLLALALVVGALIGAGVLFAWMGRGDE